MPANGRPYTPLTRDRRREIEQQIEQLRSEAQAGYIPGGIAGIFENAARETQKGVPGSRRRPSDGGRGLEAQLSELEALLQTDDEFLQHNPHLRPSRGILESLLRR